MSKISIDELSQSLKNTINIGNELKEFHKIIRTTDGYFDRGGAFGVIANNPNEDPKLGICGYYGPKHTSEYLNRDSVAEYLEINGTNPTIVYNNSDIVYTSNSVRLPSCNSFDLISEGMIIDTLHSPNKWTGIIKSIDKVTKTIYLDEGFYQVNNNSSISSPINGIGLHINAITKIYGNNTIVKIESDTTTEHAVGYEIDLCKYKNEGTIGALDLVNMGKKALFGSHIHKAFNGEGFLWGHITENCEVGIEHRFDDDNKNLIALRSIYNSSDYLEKGFALYNDGTFSKLRLFLVMIEDLNTPIAKGSSVFIFRPNTEGTFNFITPSQAETGVIKIVKNISRYDVVLIGSTFLTNDFSNNLRIKPHQSYILISDGATWHVMLDFGNPPEGYDIITNNTSIQNIGNIDTYIINSTDNISVNISQLNNKKSGFKIYIKNICNHICTLTGAGFYNTTSPEPNSVINSGESKTLIYNGNNNWFVL